MKKVFALVSIAVLAFGLVGCGTSSCDSKDIAKQALDILLKNSGMSVEKLGARAVNIVMLDKEKNVCQADIWLQPISEIKQEMNKDYVKEMSNKDSFDSLMFPAALGKQLVNLQALRLIGYKVKLRIGNDLVPVFTQDGKEFDIFFDSLPQREAMAELSRLTNSVELLTELANASMKYKVTSGDKGEYILAELVKSSGNELYENDKKSEVELVEIVKTNK